MKEQKKKRKKWPAHKYWIEFLMQDKELYAGEHKTINHALAVMLISRDSKKHGEKEINRFAEYLSGGRNKGIIMLWKSGNERYITGPWRIEAITANPDDKEEHLSRMGQMLDTKKIAIGHKSSSATMEQRKQFGLPGQKEIGQVKKRLLLGNVEAIVSVK